MSRLILGINSAHADSSAALVGPGGLIAAIAEERINRKKHCSGFPGAAVREVLAIAGASPSDVTDVAVARDPQANLAAKARFVAQHPASGLQLAARRLQVHRHVADTDVLADALGTSAAELRFTFHNVEHHLAHIASAFYGSPVERATGISVDGAGDFASSMVALCEGTKITPLRRTHWPHSLGVFYTALCQFIGFDRFGEEYKVMGLSAYGVNRYAQELRQIVSWDPKRGYRLNLRYFQHQKESQGMEVLDGDEVSIPRLWGDELADLFGRARVRGHELTDRDRDLAASMQLRFEGIYSQLVADAVSSTGQRTVVMAGGCVLNSVANGRLLTERVVDRAYFHPAASDDGTAAGAALYVWHNAAGGERTPPLRNAYLGPEYTDEQIAPVSEGAGMPFKKLSREDLLGTAAHALSEGKILGWFQGREEWGPRALGNRSILCNPGWPGMKATLNARIKNREPFRPFAPAVLKEKLSECFHGDHEVPYMICVYKVRPEWKERLSAVTHEDGTGRVQTVAREDNALYYDLIKAFADKTGIPVLLNTSFNENEPIVHTPQQALDCFLRTKMDCLALGNFWFEKPPEG